MGLTTDQLLVPMLALLMHLIYNLVGTIFGWRKVILAEEMDVGLDARPLVFVIVDELDPVKGAARHGERGPVVYLVF